MARRIFAAVAATALIASGCGGDKRDPVEAALADAGVIEAEITVTAPGDRGIERYVERHTVTQGSNGFLVRRERLEPIPGQRRVALERFLQLLNSRDSGTSRPDAEQLNQIAAQVSQEERTLIAVVSQPTGPIRISLGERTACVTIDEPRADEVPCGEETSLLRSEEIAYAVSETSRGGVIDGERLVETVEAGEWVEDDDAPGSLREVLTCSCGVGIAELLNSDTLQLDGTGGELDPIVGISGELNHNDEIIVFEIRLQGTRSEKLLDPRDETPLRPQGDGPTVQDATPAGNEAVKIGQRIGDTAIAIAAGAEVTAEHLIRAAGGAPARVELQDQDPETPGMQPLRGTGATRFEISVVVQSERFCVSVVMLEDPTTGLELAKGTARSGGCTR